MKYISDDLSLYTDKQFRSSDVIIEVWNYIEDNLLYAMGISNCLIISIYIDNDSVILSCSSNYDVICSIRKTFNINHILTIMNDLSISTTINLNITNINNINYKKCSFYYEKNNIDDDGSIEIECDANYNIESYKDFKFEIISAISKELQFLIHRNILNSDISTCDIANIDAELETINVYSTIKNQEKKKSLEKLLTLNKINKTVGKKLYSLLERIDYD